MGLNIILGVLLYVASIALATDNEEWRHVPGAYIIELEDSQDLSTFSPSIVSSDEIRRTFDFSLFKGIAVQLKGTENDRADSRAFSIASTATVKNVWPVREHSRPNVTVHSSGKPGPEDLEMRQDNGSDTFGPHVMTQVDKLRAEGYTGKGVKIALIDTGVDYKHPALGGCFGEGCLVSFGRDLTGDGFTGENQPVPDSDPMDCTGHGTHVSGIIAAQKNDLGFTGAAPDATLGMYKVFGCQGHTTTDVLIAALYQAFEDGADVISSSIGEASGWAGGAWATAASRIVEKGVPCIMSAGNDGTTGPFYASSGPSGKSAIAVAAFNNIEFKKIVDKSVFTVDGGEEAAFIYELSNIKPAENVSLPLWSPGRNNSGCSSYPDTTPDLSKFVVLLSIGDCTEVEKAKFAAAKGASHILFSNNGAGTQELYLYGVDGLKSASVVTSETGTQWLRSLEAGSKIVVALKISTLSEKAAVDDAPQVGPGSINVVTSWGPTWDLDIRPQFGATGGFVLSTYPLNLGSYAVLSGTSMAAPLVTAVYAILAEVRGKKLAPADFEALLSANANPQVYNFTEVRNYLAPVPQQGAGLIQAYDAAYAKTLLSPASLSYQDLASGIESLNFTISNIGQAEVEYQISDVSTASIYALPSGNLSLSPQEAGGLTFSENKVRLAGGASHTVTAHAAPPKSLDPMRLPIWSGWVAVNGSDGTSLSIPYQGVAGKLDEIDMLPQNQTFAEVFDWDAKTFVRVPENAKFTLPAPGNSSTEELPRLRFNLVIGSPEVRANVVPVAADGQAQDVVGQLERYPWLWAPRHSLLYEWKGMIANGTYLPAGRYKFVFQALRRGGDANKNEDWHVAETVTMDFTYAEG
ncbi:unnamed protein product [Clonostachys rosea f. rosea IK726]|uniref:Peptidase S8/S53 domain-containing protein n=2 Tax=Bionectria ochroleuca TaxID=29856 RepID=A0A0B7K9E8_BIOOC|nr:unnamed protein product [Clonostachys rosea f. rosea IK726]